MRYLFLVLLLNEYSRGLNSDPIRHLKVFCHQKNHLASYLMKCIYHTVHKLSDCQGILDSSSLLLFPLKIIVPKKVDNTAKTRWGEEEKGGGVEDQKRWNANFNWNQVTGNLSFLKTIWLLACLPALPSHSWVHPGLLLFLWLCTMFHIRNDLYLFSFVIRVPPSLDWVHNLTIFCPLESYQRVHLSAASLLRIFSSQIEVKSQANIIINNQFAKKETKANIWGQSGGSRRCEEGKLIHLCPIITKINVMNLHAVLRLTWRDSFLLFSSPSSAAAVSAALKGHLSLMWWTFGACEYKLSWGWYLASYSSTSLLAFIFLQQ